MSEYSNEQLHEAYSIEHHAHKQTQEMFNNEVKQHALTRRKLLETVDIVRELELDYIVQGAGRFYDTIGLEPLDNAREYYQSVLEIQGAFSVVNPGKGFIVGFITPSFLEPHKTQCQELAWWVEPEYRGTSVAIRLLKEYEKRAVELGADQIGMVCLQELDMDGLDSIYKRMGYRLYEQHYVKDI